MSPKPKPHAPRFWRLLRIYFRRFRISVWLIVLAIVGVLVYLNQVGLPEFVKKPLLENLRARGLDLQFSRLRLMWHEGIVAEDARFGQPDDPASPFLTVKEIQLRLEPASLLRLRPQIDSLVLQHGRLVWPILESNQPPRQLTIDDIQTNLRFLTNDVWALDDLEAIFAGARIRFSGYLTNASAIRQWHFPRKGPSPAGKTLSYRLRQISDRLEQVQFTATPDLNLNIDGDALNLQSFSLRLLVAAPGARTPWGDFNQGRLTVKLFPATNLVSHAQISLDAVDAQTPWGSFTNLNLQATLDADADRADLVHGQLELNAGAVLTKWASGQKTRLTADWVHSLTNPVPLLGQGDLHCESATSRWGEVTNLFFHAHLQSTRPGPLLAPDPSLAWWTNIQPYALNWHGRADKVQHANVSARDLALSGRWAWPDLTISNLSAALADGRIDLHADLDIASRALDARLRSNIDPLQIAPVLPEAATRWLSQFTWPQAPAVQGRVAVVLPAWTNRQPDWSTEVLPTLQLDGRFNTDAGGSYRGLQVLAASSHFSYSNLSWQLPDLTLSRPEGKAIALHRANDRTKEFYWKVASTIDPQALRPLLKTNEQQVFNLLSFGQPPSVELEVLGCGRAPQTFRMQGQAAVTNVTFRGQTADAIHASFHFTNNVLRIFEPRARSGSQRLAADSVTVDLNTQQIFLTNGQAFADPMFVAHAIGPQVAHAINDYRFLEPINARVNGIIPMHGEEGADLLFNIEGGPFEWWKFHLPRVSGTVHWMGLKLKLSDVRASFYGGQAQGYADFDLAERGSTKFNFVAYATNAILQQLVPDLFPNTKGLEGLLNATVVVTRANTAITNDIQGYGSAELRDGLIWDMPVFGVFSPILNALTPGLGYSRASSATCSFDMTNAVLHSKDLLIKSQGFRLKYAGWVDLDGRTSARAEAELLRDVWFVGPLVSTVFWPVTKMFEYKVSGTLEEPKLEPLYIFPKLMLIPFQPFKTLKSILPQSGPSRNSNTNTPPPVK